MVFNNNLLLGAAGQGGGTTPFDPTLIGNSVWLDGSADYLNRTPSSAGTTTRWIVSCWVQPNKVDNLADSQTIFSAGTALGNITWLGFSSLNQLDFYVYQSGVTARKTSSAKYRDVGWYHICVSFDSGSGIPANDRIKLFVNGIEVTDLSANTDTPSGETTAFNDNVLHEIGRYSYNSTRYIPAYLAQFTMLENKSFQNGDLSISDLLDSFTFGTNGAQYVPKADADIAALATAAGGNSFCLDFADSGDLGNDISSNANDFTPNSMSSANQSGNTPSHVSTIFNVINAGSTSYAILSEGNRKASWVSSGGHSFTTTLSFDGSDSSGFYIEIETPTTNGIDYPAVGVWSTLYLDNNTLAAKNSSGSPSLTLGFNDGSWRLNPNGTKRYHNNVSSTVTGTALSSGGRFAICVKNNKLYIGTISGTTLTWSNSGDPDAETGELYTLDASDNKYQIGGIVYSTGNLLLHTNSDEWVASSIPSDVKSITSDNLAAPDYQGIDYFNATLYTGNGTAIGSGGKAVTGVGFQPDFTWIKNRDAADSHILTDVVRGVTKYISSDSFNAEVTNVESLSTFDTDGFTVGNLDAVNTNTEDYVSWNWLAGGTGSSNTDGSITSTVTVAGAGHFSIGTYTGTGANATIGHGLGGAPEMIIVKNTGTAENWPVYHNGIASDAETDVLFLNNTLAASDSPVYWNDTAPTSSVFTVGTDNAVNASSGTLSFFAFRSVPGVCKVGSYTGNGNADGPFVSLNFNPKLFLLKRTDVANDWLLGYLPNGSNSGEYLFANSNVTGGTLSLDMLSTSIKIRTSGTTYNASGGNYVFLAMADIGGNGTLPPIYGR